jgi:hypothetical protein
VNLLVPPPTKRKNGNHGALGHGIEMLDKAKVALVVTTLAANHKCLVVHEGYIQGHKDMRDRKYEAQMLDASRVVKYVGPRTTKTSQALFQVPDEKVPIKGTLLEYKTNVIFDLPVAPTSLIPEPLTEQVIGPTQEKTMVNMPYNDALTPTLQPTVEASG